MKYVLWAIAAIFSFATIASYAGERDRGHDRGHDRDFGECRSSVPENGDKVIAVDSTKEVTIIATAGHGSYVIRDAFGNIYTNISYTDLARECGCNSGFCVGQPAIAVDSGKDVTIIALQPGGNFVVRDRFGNMYANIGVNDLARERGRDGDIRAGEKVIAVDSTKECTVVAIQGDGSFVIRDGFGNTYSNISRGDLAVEHGCQDRFCVNDQAIAVDSSKQVTVVGLEQGNQFVVRDQFGNMYANIGASDLAVMTGRMGNIGVGDKVYAVDSGKEVTAIALQDNGQYVIKDAFGNVYTNIGSDDLAVEWGRVGNLVVGNRAIALDSGKQVTLVALQSNRSFVIRDQFGNVYANITASDLAAM